MNRTFYAKGRMKAGERNKTEAAYEALLNAQQAAGQILWHRFEGLKLRLADGCFFTPDFAVLTDTHEIECHEVKGARAIFRDDAKVKIKCAAEMYPFRFRLAFPKKGGGWEIEEVGA